MVPVDRTLLPRPCTGQLDESTCLIIKQERGIVRGFFFASL